MDGKKVVGVFEIKILTDWKKRYIERWTDKESVTCEDCDNIYSFFKDMYELIREENIKKIKENTEKVKEITKKKK